MKYAYWTGARRLCTVSEPFLTPIIQHIFNTIGGNGVPDYPDHMKQILKQILEDFSKTPGTAAIVATTVTVVPASEPAAADRIAVLPEIVAAIAASPITSTSPESNETQTTPQEVTRNASNAAPIPAIPTEQSSEPAV
jgi:hypothetical protein